MKFFKIGKDLAVYAILEIPRLFVVRRSEAVGKLHEEIRWIML